MTKLAYLRRSLAAQFVIKRFNCPNCNCERSCVVDRKFVVTQLRRCASCRLLFRTPTDDPTNNEQFYETSYSQGFTTELPSDEELAELKRSNFACSEKDYFYYINVLTQLGLTPGALIFDYGCSWGYGSYQLAMAGFDVVSYEVARSRRRYAKEKLDVRIIDDMDLLLADCASHFDCFFSAHVIEHVPSAMQTFNFAMRALKHGGLFVSFTPNGSNAHRSTSRNWSKLWGEVHPNFIDDVFLDESFRRAPRSVGSSPVINVSIPKEPRLKRLDKLGGSELFFVAQKIGNAWK
jgi:2-polyprenyl-3-methyl-5-hydroxy-6-metoxy-1,4-benzoquinol methylase